MLATASLPASEPRHLWPAGARVRYDAVRVRRLRYRRFHRARFPVTVLTVIGPHKATIRGLGLYGACLVGGRRLRRREMIALRLPSGDRITARVRWRFGARSGVVFGSPVADFARLIGEGALVQSLHKRRRTRATPPPLRFAAVEAAAEGDKIAVDRLRNAVAKAWSLIEQAFATRATGRRSTVRRSD